MEYNPLGERLDPGECKIQENGPCSGSIKIVYSAKNFKEKLNR